MKRIWMGCLAGILMLGAIMLTGCRSIGPASPLAPGADFMRVGGAGAGESRREAGVQPIKPGARLVLMDERGPGLIRHMWFTAHCAEPRAYAGLVLRAWWDGEAAPSIEVPLSDMGGGAWGEEPLVNSVAVEMIPAGLPGHAALNVRLPMPFRRAARIEVENQNAEEAALFYFINWEHGAHIDPAWGRMHIQWRRTNPVERGQGHTILQTRGAGAYVGSMIAIRRLEPGAWVEGGEDWYIDISDDEWGALEEWNPALVRDPARRPRPEERSIANQPMGPLRPTIAGVGLEDYFGRAWGFNSDESFAMHDVTVGPDEFPDGTGRMAAVRWHLDAPVRFRRNLWLHFRNHGWDVQARADDITSVAFWYQREPHAAFPPLPPLADRLRGAEDMTALIKAAESKDNEEKENVKE